VLHDAASLFPYWEETEIAGCEAVTAGTKGSQIDCEKGYVIKKVRNGFHRL